MKHLKIAGVVALALAVFAAPALAETQTVKVSGSLDVLHVFRRNLDLRDNNDQGAVPVGVAPRAVNAATGSVNDGSESDNFFASIAQVEVAADLTDNVSVVIRLVNQRDWNSRAFQALNDTAINEENDLNEFDVALDLAYVTMKEIWYAPLTLTVGRQDIWVGRGNILGAVYLDPNNNLSANEFTALTAFDALRGTLDFAPWTVDLFWIIVDENAIDAEDDTQFYFMNANYQFSDYNAEAEAYVGTQDDRNTIARTTTTSETGDRLWLVGGRAQFDPISQMTLGAEVAYQFGDYAQAAGAHRDRGAWFIEIFGEYEFQSEWDPTLGLQFVHTSGEDVFSGTDEYNAWNSLYRGPTWGDIRDWAETFYATASARDTASGTNQNHISLYGNISPMEDIMVDAWWYYFWTDEDYLAGGTTGANVGDEIGNEIDIHITYDYTEDVAFATWLAWFFPGDVYEDASDDTATQVITSVSVAF